MAEDPRIEHQGDSPLRYNRTRGVGRIERLGVVVPGMPLPEPVRRPVMRASAVPEQEYWAPSVTVGMGETGKRLKNPKTVQNPSAAAEGTVAFADVEHLSHENGVYLHYGMVRPDQRGQGHMERLVSHIGEQFDVVDFGRVMHPAMWHLKERLEQQGSETRGRPDF